MITGERKSQDKNNQPGKDALYSYLFHYNPYTGYWNAFLRDKANQYLNGTLDENDVIKAKDYNDIVKYITKNG